LLHGGLLDEGLRFTAAGSGMDRNNVTATMSF
jgi:hypothetical protein